MPGPTPPTGLASIGRALRHRNYRLFFAGQGISLVGTWLTRVATSWLVYRLTGSATLLGIVGFAGQIPTFLLAPLAGVLVDRWDRYRVLLATQVLAALQSGVLAVLAITGVINVWHVLALSILQGLINAFDMPARQSMVVQMVEDRADLPNAIALNSSMVNAARLLGPAAAGVLIASVGEGWCFFVDAISYVAVMVSLLMMRIAHRPRPAASKRVWHEMRDGFRYVSGFAPIRAVLLLLAAVSLLGMPYTTLMPIIADKILHGGAGMLGALTSASGLGALVGALYLASRKSVVGLGRVTAATSILFGSGLVALSLVHVAWLALPLMLLVGAGMMVQLASSNTILQTLVDEDKRGRVMSLFAMSIFGAVPFGSLICGPLADKIGAQPTLMLGGVGCLIAGAIFVKALPALAREVRPIYVRMGILPGGE